jgi:ankyrin repeat protein
MDPNSTNSRPIYVDIEGGLERMQTYVEKMSRCVWLGDFDGLLKLSESCPFYIFNSQNDRGNLNSFVSTDNVIGQSLLYVAARKGEVEMIKILLQYAAKRSISNKLEIVGLNLKNKKNGSTALHGMLLPLSLSLPLILMNKFLKQNPKFYRFNLTLIFSFIL